MCARLACLSLLLATTTAFAQNPPPAASGRTVTCGEFRRSPDGTWTLLAAPRIIVNGATLQTGAVFNALISFGDTNLAEMLDTQCQSGHPRKEVLRVQ